MIEFAAQGIVRKYYDPELQVWGLEPEDGNSHIADCPFVDDIEMYVDEILQHHMVFPDVEGYYKYWVVALIHYDQDYWGEWDSTTEVLRSNWYQIDIETMKPIVKVASGLKLPLLKGKT